MDANEIHQFIEDSWETYVAQPSNFGADDHATRMAEHDAFYAGALAMLHAKIPF